MGGYGVSTLCRNSLLSAIRPVIRSQTIFMNNLRVLDCLLDLANRLR